MRQSCGLVWGYLYRLEPSKPRCTERNKSKYSVVCCQVGPTGADPSLFFLLPKSSSPPPLHSRDAGKPLPPLPAPPSSDATASMASSSTSEPLIRSADRSKPPNSVSARLQFCFSSLKIQTSGLIWFLGFCSCGCF
jgi:hypothetical protein